MNLPTRRLHEFFGNVYIAFFGAVASIVALLLWLIDKYNITFSALTWWIIASTAFFLFSGIAIYSIKVRLENIQFRNLTEILHEINHNYRDALCSIFKHPDGQHMESGLLNLIEKK